MLSRTPARDELTSNEILLKYFIDRTRKCALEISVIITWLWPGDFHEKPRNLVNESCSFWVPRGCCVAVAVWFWKFNVHISIDEYSSKMLNIGFTLLTAVLKFDPGMSTEIESTWKSDRRIFFNSKKIDYENKNFLENFETKKNAMNIFKIPIENFRWNQIFLDYSFDAEFPYLSIGGIFSARK